MGIIVDFNLSKNTARKPFNRGSSTSESQNAMTDQCLNRYNTSTLISSAKWGVYLSSQEALYYWKCFFLVPVMMRQNWRKITILEILWAKGNELLKHR